MRTYTTQEREHYKMLFKNMNPKLSKRAKCNLIGVPEQTMHDWINKEKKVNFASTQDIFNVHQPSVEEIQHMTEVEQQDTLQVEPEPVAEVSASQISGLIPQGVPIHFDRMALKCLILAMLKSTATPNASALAEEVLAEVYGR